MSQAPQRIAKITLDEGSVVRRSPEVEHERAVALYDLIEENSFQPLGEGYGAHPGPYHLHLAIEESRLVFDVRDANDQGLGQVQLSLLPFRRIVKDYFHVCESYFDAIKTASPSKIEAIDMGRRGLHDEGSTLLMERLADKIAIDHPTARRLFTLICVLHIKG